MVDDTRANQAREIRNCGCRYLWRRYFLSSFSPRRLRHLKSWPAAALQSAAQDGLARQQRVPLPAHRRHFAATHISSALGAKRTFELALPCGPASAVGIRKSCGREPAAKNITPSETRPRRPAARNRLDPNSSQMSAVVKTYCSPALLRLYFCNLQTSCAHTYGRGAGQFRALFSPLFTPTIFAEQRVAISANLQPHCSAQYDNVNFVQELRVRTCRRPSPCSWFIWRQRSCHRRASPWTFNFWSVANDDA